MMVICFTKADFPTPPEPRTTSLYSLMSLYMKSGFQVALGQSMIFFIFGFILVQHVLTMEQAELALNLDIVHLRYHL